ncbi:MAG: substrate-binding domain-containing protein [Bdellovibrionales bacterium]|nr:substrate-binding domain-containing protein [Bdellovibrionales bacterium]
MSIRMSARALAAGFMATLCVTISGAAFAKKPLVGFILSTMQEERYQRDKRVFEETAAKLGAEVVFASCNNNEQTQAAQVDNLLSRGVQALVIQPVNGDTASAFVKQAHEDGVPVVDYDRLIKNAPISAYITEDSHTVGRLQAEAAVKFTKGKGNYVLVMGQAGHSVAEARTAGALSVLKNYPEIKVVVKQYHQGWSPALAMKTMEDALTRYDNKIDAVIANNSGMAHGAIQAIEEQKLSGKVFVAGADADLASIRDIVSGKQQFEVLISINDMARRAAEVAVALAKKEKFAFDAEVDNGMAKIKTVNTPVFGIDKGSLEERIIRTGFHTRDAIFGKISSRAQ